MPYALESMDEFKRLEQQSRLTKYDFRKELQPLFNLNIVFENILDAGCGSGIVSRYLASEFPTSTIVGCDNSQLRIQQASEAAKEFSNLRFDIQNIEQLDYPPHSFDLVIVRYLFQHLSTHQQPLALANIFHVLKPKGKVFFIDIDGGWLNVHPQTPIVRQGLELLEKCETIDLRAARKLPQLMHRTGFHTLEWSIEVMNFHGSERQEECRQVELRFDQTKMFFTELFGSEKKAERFAQEYLKLIACRETVLFYNKFLITGQK